MPTETKFQLDKPITSIKEDRFDRTEFAIRLANYCIENTSESHVVGINAKWGEGKSSVLNMVLDCLPENIVKIKFNPWLFEDSNHLILAFLREFADSLKKQLNTKGEKLAGFLEKYGDSLQLVGYAGGLPINVFSGAGGKLAKLFKKPSLNETRQRVDDFIVKSGHNIVVAIEDIDRLDASEAQAMFKAVKLLADFPRTTYLLAFDADQIAEMLAPAFGSSSSDAGYRFLEKIIQTPLVLPKASNKNLHRFVLDCLEQVFEDNFENDRRFEMLFQDCILPLISNPRKAVRYCNGLRLSASLLKGEANLLDLIVIEATKVALPTYYQLIRDNMNLFTLNDWSENEQRISNDNFQNWVEDKTSLFNNVELQVIKNINRILFRKSLQSSLSSEPDLYDNLMVDKRICTPYYFERYFTYSIQKGEISDIHFSKIFLNNSNPEISLNDIEIIFRKTLSMFSIEDILAKLSTHRKKVSGIQGKNLIYGLCRVSDLFQKDSDVSNYTLNLAALCVEALLSNQDRTETFGIAQKAINECNSSEFISNITGRFVLPKDAYESSAFFDDRQALILKEQYIERVKQNIGEKSIFNDL